MNHSPAAWRQIVIQCLNGYEDIVSAIAFETGCTGIIEETGPESISLTISWNQNSIPDPLSAIRKGIAELSERTGTIPARLIKTTDIPWQDWETSWRKDLTAAESGERLVVRPSWVSYDNTDDRIEIIIDPRMAFGTGHHATTALCLEALETCDMKGKRVIDAGIGSGVLAIAAVKLGASQVHGFDHDEWSVSNARDNTTINGVSDKIRIDHASLVTWISEPADIVLANMISGVLIPNLHIFTMLTKPGGLIVFSGLLSDEESLFTNAARSAGCIIDRVTWRDEWIAVYATVPSR